MMSTPTQINSKRKHDSERRLVLTSIITVIIVLLATWGGTELARADSLDVTCSTQALAASILNANANTLIDTLVLEPNCVYEYSDDYVDSGSALPPIRNSLTIQLPGGVQ